MTNIGAAVDQSDMDVDISADWARSTHSKVIQIRLQVVWCCIRVLSTTPGIPGCGIIISGLLRRG